MLQAVVLSALFFVFSIGFLLVFALPAGLSEKTNEKMFSIALRFALSATGIFFALWFLSHPFQ